MNVVMVHSNQRAGFAQHNLYTMDMDKRNRNYYSCGRFGHLVRNRRTENRTGKRRRAEYGQDYRRRLRIEGENGQNNLNRERNLIVFN